MKHSTHSCRLCAALLLILLAAVNAANVAGFSFTVGDITYNTLNNSDEVEVAPLSSGKYAGDITIPESVYYRYNTYKVTSIGERAFENCTNLKSISMPEGLTKINYFAFLNCTGLTSISIPNSVQILNVGCFQGCDGLTTVTIPKNVSDCDYNPFSSCRNLQAIEVDPDNSYCTSENGIVYSKDKREILAYPAGKTDKKFSIPGNVNIIGNCAFEGCSNLTNINVGLVYKIGVSAFSGCSSLTSITVPKGVKEIKSCTFSGCTSLEQIQLYDSVTKIGYMAFDHCNLTELFIWATEPLTLENDCFYGLNTTIWCSQNNYNTIKSHWKGQLCVYDNPVSGVKNLKSYLCGVSFNFVQNPYYHWKDPRIFADVSNINGNVVKTDIDLTTDFNFIKGLKPEQTYYLEIYFNDRQHLLYKESFKTRKPFLEVQSTSTQSTITLSKVVVSPDESMEAAPVVTYEPIDGSEQVYNGGTVKISDLLPDDYVSIRADYDGYKVYQYVKTKTIGINIEENSLSPTTVTLTGKIDKGDANIHHLEWRKSEKEAPFSKESNVSLTNLIPSSSHTINFYVFVRNKKGNRSKSFSTNIKFSTPSVKIELLKPYGVSEKKSIVAAQTNLSDEETSVGFQWKKYDAPESLPFSEAYTAVYDGRIEGVLHNLQPTYYKVRAFFKDANGDYYYSDMATFDPTDFSFFEPTVHTYPATVSETSVQLTGYALEGSDDIRAQGFEYWEDGATPSARHSVPASSGITTVVAKGQRMTVEITGLKGGTVYGYRAFVETAQGRTYGEEQQFTTPDTGGVNDITVDAPELTVVAYYDLAGRRFDAPQNGFNIVVYSDGSTKKIFIKH